MWFFWILFSYFVSYSWGIPMMKITGLSHIFKWENLHNWWLTKIWFACPSRSDRLVYLSVNVSKSVVYNTLDTVDYSRSANVNVFLFLLFTVDYNAISNMYRNCSSVHFIYRHSFARYQHWRHQRTTAAHGNDTFVVHKWNRLHIWWRWHKTVQTESI